MVLLIAWVFRITVFVLVETWIQTAALLGVPSMIVVAVAVFYTDMGLLAFWPDSREAKVEFHGEEAGKWKQH